MDRQSLSPEPAGGHDFAAQRNAVRDSLFLAATLWTDALPPEQVRVRNLSAGGLMAEYPAPIATGTRIEIELRGIGLVGGQIAWATDGRIGIAFDQAIDPMLARKPVGAGRR